MSKENKELKEVQKRKNKKLELEKVRKQIDERMAYRKEISFEKAREWAKRAINKPDIRNYYEKGGTWYNKKYSNQSEASKAYARALRDYKDKK